MATRPTRAAALQQKLEVMISTKPWRAKGWIWQKECGVGEVVSRKASPSTAAATNGRLRVELQQLNSKPEPPIKSPTAYSRSSKHRWISKYKSSSVLSNSSWRTSVTDLTRAELKLSGGLGRASRGGGEASKIGLPWSTTTYLTSFTVVSPSLSSMAAPLNGFTFCWVAN